MKKLVLKTGEKFNYRYSIRSSREDFKMQELAREKLNSLNPCLKLSKSDFCLMSIKNFSTSILNEEIKISLDIPQKNISFKLKRGNRK